MSTLVLALSFLADDPVPKDDDVVAGPWGALVFVLLIAATAFLLWNFTKQLKKAQAAKDAGVYGDEPAASQAEPPARQDDPADQA